MASILKDNAQSSSSFFTVENAIDDFLAKCKYDKSDEIFFNKTLDQASGQEQVHICFNKLLNKNGFKPLPIELASWEFENGIMFRHTYSIVIYEFKCKPLTLRMIKRNIDIKKYL